MKKIALFVLGIALAASLTGCASILKAMGGVSKAEFAAYQSSTEQKLREIDDVKASLTKLADQINTMQMTAQELKSAKEMVDSLSARVETLSDETLLKLVQLIQDSLANKTPAAPPATK